MLRCTCLSCARFNFLIRIQAKRGKLIYIQPNKSSDKQIKCTTVLQTWSFLSAVAFHTPNQTKCKTDISHSFSFLHRGLVSHRPSSFLSHAIVIVLTLPRVGPWPFSFFVVPFQAAAVPVFPLSTHPFFPRCCCTHAGFYIAIHPQRHSSTTHPPSP